MNRLIMMLAGALLVAGCGGGGNDVLLDPPASGQGFQLNVPKFEVAAGDEVQSCYFFAVPGAAGQDVWVNHFKLAANTGTHHMNIFRVKTVVDLGGQPGDVVVSKNGTGPCFKSSNWADWPLVANTQDGGQTVDWTLPDGVGQKFSGGELLMLQIHFVNATTQMTPEGGRGAANFYTLPSAPAMEMGRSSRPIRTFASARARPTRPSRRIARRRCRTPPSSRRTDTFTRAACSSR